jgi:tripartite ATP-independent transporter DctP family solute receptor
MNERRRISTWPVALAVAVGLAVVVGLVMVHRQRAGGARILKMAHGLDAEHPVHKAMLFMAERLAEKSGGRLRLEIFPNGQLGQEREFVEQLQLGCMDLTKVSAASLESFVPEMGVFSVPYVFRDAGHFWRVMESPVGRRFLSAAESKGLHGVCYYDSGSRNFYTLKKQIRTPDDLAGMKIRVITSKTQMEMAKALGASPTPIPWGELYTALQQGVVDGAENNPPSFITARHYEVCKFFSMDEHTRVPDVVVMSDVVWKSLAPDLQKALQEAADESSVFQRELWTKFTKECIDKSIAEGVKVEYPDQAPFVAKVQPMIEGYRGTPIGTAIDQIKAIP